MRAIFIDMNIWIVGTLVLSLISPISYTKSMLAHKSKPHKVTRLVIWFASIAGILGILGSNNLAGIIFALIFLTRATYLLIMSAIYGIGGSSKLDRVCLVLGVLAVVTYAVTRNGLLTVALGVLADLIAYIPTFVKTYRQPKSEDPIFFGIELVASLFGIFAIWEWRIDILFPVWFALSCLIVIALIYRKDLLKIAGK
jgi:hypothetical protein